MSTLAAINWRRFNDPVSVEKTPTATIVTRCTVCGAEEVPMSHFDPDGSRGRRVDQGVIDEPFP